MATREDQGCMKALVKSRAERGLWLEDIPEPTIGINDVLIRVRYTGICGTDVHIYQWDEWAQKTIPVPMAIGHEFVGEIVEVGSNVNDFLSRRHCQRRRPCGLRALPQLSCRAAAFVRAHAGSWREPAGRFCRVHLAADDQYLAARSEDQPGSRRDLRSIWQCCAYGAFVSRCWGKMC